MKKFLPVLLVALLITPIFPSTAQAAICSIISSRTVDNTAAGEGTNGANGAAFDNLGAWTLTVADAQTIGADAGVSIITTGVAGGQGTITFLGTSTVTGSIGSVAGSVLAINAGAPTKTVTFTGNVFAGTLSVTGTGTLAFTGNLQTTLGASLTTFGANGTINANGNITSTNGITTSTANTGNLILSGGTQTVTGIVGTSALGLASVTAGSGTTTDTFANNVFANTVSVSSTGTVAFSGSLSGTAAGTSSLNFAGDGVVTVAATNAAITLSGGITTSTTNTGTLNDYATGGTTAINAQVGTAALALKKISGAQNGAITAFSGDIFANTIAISGTGTMTFAGNVTGTAAGTSSLNFVGDGGITLATGKSITLSGGITNGGGAGAVQGNILMNGTSSVTGQVGTAALRLATLRGGANAGTSTFSSDVFVNTTTVTGTGTISFGGNLSGTGASILNFAADGSVTVASGKSLFLTGGGSGGFAVTNTTTNNGTLNFGGTNSVAGGLGNTGVGLRMINLTSTTAATTSVFGAVQATGFSLGVNTLTATTVAIPATGTIATTVNSATAFGKITTTGTATVLTGTTVAVNVGGYIPTGSTLVIVDGTGGTGVAASLAVTSSNPNVTFTANSATAADLTLTATRTSANSTAGNNSVISDVINGVGTPTGDFATVLGQVDAQTSTTSLNAALAELDPTNNGATTQGSFNTVNQSIGSITGHLSSVGGQQGVSTGDFWTDNGFWIKGIGNSTKQDLHNGVNGYNSTMWGTMAGMDGLVDPNTRLGFAGGYASTDLGNKGEEGGTDTDSYTGAIYFAYDDPSPWYGNFGFTFTWNDYDATRVISFLGRTATSSFDGQAYTGFADLGYLITNEGMGALQVTPTAGLTYSHLEIGGYTEEGAGAANLIVGDQDYDMLESALGVKLAYPMQESNGQWVPEVHFRWLYDFIGDKASTNSTFTGGGASFSTNGLDPEQSSFNIGAGLTFYSKGNITVTGVYDAEVADDYTSHTGQGVVRYAF